MTRNDRPVVIEITEPEVTFSLRELCERGGCHGEFVIKLVSYGIITPLEETPEARQWQFDLDALARLRKAQRLQQDLKMNLPGLAMSMDLLDEIREMRQQVDRLHRQLRQLTGDW